MSVLFATATITSKGQITIPKKFRVKYPGLVPGAKVTITLEDNEIIVFIPSSPKSKKLKHHKKGGDTA
jgi:AbrB family looped-hinge helix DNA binding protein